MVESRNLSVMFTDIKGFTARTSQSTREDLVTLLKKHEEIVVPLACAKGGSLIKTIGDAFLFTFETPTNALLAGIAIQVALGKHNAGLPKDSRIEVRMGINAGEVTEIQGDVFGDAVNIASRIEGLAEANEIFFSETVYLTMNKAEVQGALAEGELAIREVGYHQLKGVTDEVKIYTIYSGGRTEGLRTVELRTEGQIDLSLAKGLDKPGHSQTDLVLQPMAEFELGDTRPIEIDSSSIRSPPPRPTASVVRAARPTASGGEGEAIRRVWFVPALPIFTLGALHLLAGGVLHSFWIGFFGLLLMVSAHPWRLAWRHSRITLARLGASLLALVMVIFFPTTPLNEIQLRLDGLAEKLGTTGDLGPQDRTALYVMEVIRLWGHYQAGHAEAARQQLYRLWPGGETRHFSSDMAMASPTVLAPLAAFNQRLRVAWHRGVEETSLPPTSLRLKPKGDPPRLLAAMPTLRLTAKARRDEQGYAVQAVALVPVACPGTDPAPILELGGVTLLMEQGLCKYLSTQGWLASYTAKWTWSYRNDDQRLTHRRLSR